eukprot:6459662-Pyramimonas_sp.AAC.1
MREAGWERRPLPKKREDRVALTYTPDGPRTRHSSSVTPNRQYLQALVDADRLFGLELGLTSIPHWSPTPAVDCKRVLE